MRLNSLACFRSALAGCAALTLSLASAAPAATLIVDGSGKLTGATAVDVGGALYDVSFVEGTCIGLFSGCDSVSDFTFTTATVGLAINAILDQVFLDGVPGAFDAFPDLTLGCSSTTDCLAYIPYDLAGPAPSIQAGVAWNRPVTDLTATAGFSRSLDTTFSTNSVWVVFIPSAVPEPSTWAMMLFGFGVIGFSLRRRGATRPRRLESVRMHSPSCTGRS